MEHLFRQLKTYAGSGIYPYHMPGHKRRAWGELPEQLYQMDITEIDGFDNLHQPEGILLALQREAARLYGADESFYLVNGSTCGLLCAVSSVLPVGGHILMARNCHRSAYHGVYLRNLKVSYLWPPYLEEYGIFDGVTPGQVQEALSREPEIGAVLIVSPTYEGRIADVAGIADAAHRKGIPLIVDEAHGAHLGLAEGFPENSCQAGADLVIHSVHKTLPSLTQTALLHVKGERVNRGRLRRFLDIYQSSSPSYLLMASIDNALQYAGAEGGKAFGRFRRLYEEMIRQLAGCRYLTFPADPGRQDTGKLLISTRHTSLTGKQLYRILLDQYRLQTEMAAESYVLAMFTVNDGEEAYRRMTEALLEIDGRLGENKAADLGEAQDEACGVCTPGNQGDVRPLDLPGNRPGEPGDICFSGGTEEKARVPLAAAWDMPAEEVLLEESVGRPAGEFINLYPPGTPLLVPGEIMTEELCGEIRKAWAQGLTVQGIRAEESGMEDGESSHGKKKAAGYGETGKEDGWGYGNREGRIYVRILRGL